MGALTRHWSDRIWGASWGRSRGTGATGFGRRHGGSLEVKRERRPRRAASAPKGRRAASAPCCAEFGMARFFTPG
eukprot:3608432-Prymnesium_polylepis.1